MEEGSRLLVTVTIDERAAEWQGPRRRCVSLSSGRAGPNYTRLGAGTEGLRPGSRASGRLSGFSGSACYRCRLQRLAGFRL